MFDYFYGQSGEMFSYFRVPKILFRDIRFKDLSTDAKTLYGILLDRMGLSAKNGWLDGQGRVYISSTKRKMLRIAGDDKPTEVVRSRLKKLNADHIRFVLDSLAENTAPVRNMKQYLLAMLYNAPTTMNLYYLRYEKAFERIVSGCPAEDCEDGMEYNEEWEDDEYDPDEV